MCIADVDSQKLELAYNDYKEYCSIEDQTPCSLENFKSRIKNMYTGKVKLAPNKLAIAYISEASVSDEVDQTEVNPFSEYLEFVPYKFKDETYVPVVPGVEANLEQKNKNVVLKENQGGTTGTSGTFVSNSNLNSNESGLDKVQKLILEQETRRKNWDGTIEYEEPQQSNDTNDEFVEDNDDFFKRLANGDE